MSCFAGPVKFDPLGYVTPLSVRDRILNTYGKPNLFGANHLATSSQMISSIFFQTQWNYYSLPFHKLTCLYHSHHVAIFKYQHLGALRSYISQNQEVFLVMSKCQAAPIKTEYFPRLAAFVVTRFMWFVKSAIHHQSDVPSQVEW